MSSAKSVLIGNIYAADKDGDGIVGVQIQERKKMFGILSELM